MIAKCRLRHKALNFRLLSYFIVTSQKVTVVKKNAGQCYAHLI